MAERRNEMAVLRGAMGLALLALVGCTTLTGPTTPPAEDEVALCNEEEIAPWVGQDAALFDPRPGLMVRIVPPGGAMTRDIRRDRVTFMVDEDGIILRADCF